MNLEVKFRCNICRDGKVYNSIEAGRHKEETKKKGQEHNSWKMSRRRLK